MTNGMKVYLVLGPAFESSDGFQDKSRTIDVFRLDPSAHSRRKRQIHDSPVMNHLDGVRDEGDVLPGRDHREHAPGLPVQLTPNSGVKAGARAVLRRKRRVYHAFDGTRKTGAGFGKCAG